MPSLISTTNLLQGGTVYSAGGGALPTAAGYLATDVIDGQVERCWRRGAATDRPGVVVDMGEVRSFDLVAAFDARPLSASIAVTAAEVWISTVGKDGPWAKLGDLTTSPRGDGGLYVPGSSARALLFDFHLSVATDFLIGELWAGVAAATASDPVRVEKSRNRRIVLRDSLGGTVWATKRGEVQHTFVLPMPPWAQAADDAFAALVEAADGPLRPVVLVPDADDSSAIYHGRLSDDDQAVQEPDGYWRDRAIRFTESGRVLRG